MWGGGGWTQEVAEGILMALACVESSALWEANQCTSDLLITCSRARPPLKFKAQPKALPSKPPPPYGVTCIGLSTEEGAVVMASTGAASLGRCLGGGEGCRLLGEGLQQCQVLGQPGAGFHHIMFDVLPDPDR